MPFQQDADIFAHGATVGASLLGQIVIQGFGQMQLKIVRKATKAFQVLPRRWVVERTLAWLSRYRRLVRVYEKRVASSVAMIWVSSIRILLKNWVLLYLNKAPFNQLPLNLNFRIGSQAFEPAVARRLVERLEIYHTPKYGKLVE